MVPEARLLLDESNFKDLVAGKIIQKTWGIVDVKIALQDIGFEKMEDALERAITLSSKKHNNPQAQ